MFAEGFTPVVESSRQVQTAQKDPNFFEGFGHKRSRTIEIDWAIWSF
jgi:hypothetical protein